MATRATRKTLMKAEKAMFAAMTDAELEALIASEPPDPEFDAALELLSVKELEWFIDSPHATREQVLSLATGRTETP